MQTTTLSAALSSVFGTTKTTASYLPTVTSAGAPEGVISVANLASTLGGIASGTTIGLAKFAYKYRLAANEAFTITGNQIGILFCRSTSQFGYNIYFANEQEIQTIIATDNHVEINNPSGTADYLLYRESTRGNLIWKTTKNSWTDCMFGMVCFNGTT